jgi:hypothetical protein
MVSLAGSAQQQSVPVEPVWPKVRSEHPGLPDPVPTPNPNPRGVNPSGLWFRTISRAVSGFTTWPRAPRNSPKNVATSGAEACVPPQGAPSFRLFVAPAGRVSAGQLWTTGGPWSWRVWSVSKDGQVVLSDAWQFQH